MWLTSRVSACQRGLNSHNEAKPREHGCLQGRPCAQNNIALPQPNTGEVNATINWNYREPVCPIEAVRCVGSSGVQSVCRAAPETATSRRCRWRRLECAACQRLQRGTRKVWCRARIAAGH